MHILLVHQNFPAQFRHVAPALARAGWRCTFATERRDVSLDGVEKVIYRRGQPRWTGGHLPSASFDAVVAHADGVYRALKARPDVRPDLVVAHSGLGPSLFLPYLYDCPIVNFFEYFYRPVGQDLGYRPRKKSGTGSLLGKRQGERQEKRYRCLGVKKRTGRTSRVCHITAGGGELRREMLDRVTALVGPGRRNEKSKSSLADPASCAGRTIVKSYSVTVITT